MKIEREPDGLSKYLVSMSNRVDALVANGASMLCLLCQPSAKVERWTVEAADRRLRQVRFGPWVVTVDRVGVNGWLLWVVYLNGMMVASERCDSADVGVAAGIQAARRAWRRWWR